MSLLSLTKRLSGRSGKKTSAPTAKNARKQQTLPKTDAATSADTATAERGPAQPGTLLALYPVMSEKSVRLQEDNIATFRVPHTATKRQVALAIKQRYHIEPREIRIVYGRPKQRRRGQTQGRTVAWKKAYVKVDNIQSLTAGP